MSKGVVAFLVIGVLLVVGVIVKDRRDHEREERHLPKEMVIKHLRWGGGVQLPLEQAYDQLKTHLENDNKGRFELDGRRIIFTTSAENCVSMMANLGELIPNGAEMECREGTHTEWLMDRK